MENSTQEVNPSGNPTVNNDSFEWKNSELKIRKSRMERSLIQHRYSRSVMEALLIKLKNSVFGSFIDIFNSHQTQNRFVNQNKLEILEWTIKNFDQKDIGRFEKENDFIENSYEFLRRIISEDKLVTSELLAETVKSLRLEAIYITKLDQMLPRFTNLQILSLPGNNIIEIDGSLLPRTLKYLELFDNFIQNIEKLVHMPPPKLLHLGLGRNCLDEGSFRHLPSHHKIFKFLKSLDLSNNEISCLDTIVNIDRLGSPGSLQLEGNPCYFYPNYSRSVLNVFPKLVYLDGTEVLSTDLKPKIFGTVSPKIIFHCYRILGLQAPPKDLKYMQTIHVELDLPLLEPTKQIKNELPLKQTGSQLNATSNSNKNSKSPKLHSVYQKPNEIWNRFCFKTERKIWSNNIEFSTLIIPCSLEDLKALQETFRSCVTIRVVYLKTALPKVATGKSNDSIYGISSMPELNNIFKKITICSFKCNLEPVNWSDETVDYYWADHPDIGEKAIKVDGCLKNLEYEGISKPVLGKSSSISSKDPRRSSFSGKTFRLQNREPYPKFLTCQIGFGLKRL